MMGDLVFHYTTVESALSIFQSGCLFASHAKFLNDSLEFDFAKTEAVRAIKERSKEEMKYLTGVDIVEYPNSEVLVQAITDPLQALSTTFVACFADPKGGYEKSNGVLSLWRGYGSKGVALVFDKSDLPKAMAIEQNNYRYVSILDRNVTYLDPDERPSGRTLELFRKIADLTPWAFSADAKKYDLTYPHERATVQPTDRIDEIVELFSFTKHASFREESEFRLAATAINSSNPEAKKERKTVEFRYSNGAVVPYIRLPLKIDQKSIVKGILVGPSAHQDRLASSLEEFARLNNLSLEVWKSSIPYISV